MNKLAATHQIIKKSYILLLLLVCYALSSHGQELKSPDRNVTIHITSNENLQWSVNFKDKTLLNPSDIGLTINGKPLSFSKVKKQKTEAIQNKITPVVALKTSSIDDHYNSLLLEFSHKFNIEFRAYNNGAAYRFISTQNKEIIVDSEIISLQFPESTISYFPEEESIISHNERSYEKVKVSEIKKDKFCSLPVLFQNDAISALFTEADLYDYPGLYLTKTDNGIFEAKHPKYVTKATPTEQGGDRNEILEYADYIAKTKGARNFPWRVLAIADNDKDLLTNQLVYQLSRPNQIKDPAWIKPGKVAWDWYNDNNIYGVDFKSGINNDTYKYYIDFASKYGIDYVILDEGWSKSTTNILEPTEAIDVAELVKYGKNKNVGIILWALWKPLDKDAEVLLQQYEDWGVKGIKVDFMQRSDQYMVNYYERIAKMAAAHHLLVDYHGAFKPSGLRRAYPNLLSYEGVKGNENNKWSDLITPEHTVTLPFTRMVSGPMDFTPGSMVNTHKINYNISFSRPMSLGTRCHQVAMYVIYESPLQMLCESPSRYYQEEETTEFIAQIPTTWDETIALSGKIADHVIMARKKGSNWYVGAMTAANAKDYSLDLSFLPEGNYTIEIMEDGANAHKFAEDYKKSKQKITNKDKIEIKMAAGGGWAAIIKPL